MKEENHPLLSKTNILIETALLKDATAISKLGKQTFRETFGYLFPEKVLENYLEETFNVEKIHQSLQKTHNQYLLASIDGQLVGYAKLKLHSCQPIFPQARQMQLQKLYVLNQAIGQGVGARLMKESIQIAKEHGFSVMWLSVLDANYRAISFYQQFNFRKTGELTVKIQNLVFHYDLMKLKTYE